MDNNKIGDNPSYKKLRRDIEGMEGIKRITKFFSFLGLKNDGLEQVFKKLPELKKQLEISLQGPDKFNKYFAERGWIAHESMNADLMQTSIELAEKGQIEGAEQALVNYYTSEEMEWLIHMLKGIDTFSIRYNFFLLAYEDTIAERYHAVVPLLLIMIDGVVNDIDKGKGFFAENTDVTAWDSIAAHSSGLLVLKKLFGDSRKKTTTEEIILPYRNGILHGRDLGFANKVVAAKCWAAIFAIRDWGDVVKQGKKKPPPHEPEPTFIENIYQLKESLAKYSESKKRNTAISKLVEEWKAREIEVGVDIPIKGAVDEYRDYTPEQEAIRFADNWMRNNYGAIANQIHSFSQKPVNIKGEAGRIRKIFEGKKLLDYQITTIKDCAPVISEVTLSFVIEIQDMKCDLELTLRLIYSGEQGQTLVFGEFGGYWKFIESFFYKIEQLPYIQ